MSLSRTEMTELLKSGKEKLEIRTKTNYKGIYI